MPIAEDGSRVGASFYSGTSKAAMAAAVRAFTDSNSARIAAAASASQQVIATITVVTPGGAGDENAAVLVLWRGTVCSVAGYLASYTPVAGHRVVCAYIDNQLIITGRIIGQP